MKKFSIVLLTFLTIGNTPWIAACGGWTEKYILMLLNKHKQNETIVPCHCSDFETLEEQKACSRLKQEFVEALAEHSEPYGFLISANPDRFNTILSKKSAFMRTMIMTFLDSSQKLTSQFPTYKALSEGLKSEDKKTRDEAEDVLADIVKYQHEKTSSKSDYPAHNGIERSLFLETETADKAPKCQ